MKSRLLISALFFLTVSCSFLEDFRHGSGEDEYDKVVMNMAQADLEDSETSTRNEAVIGDQVDFVWSVTDSVGIFPDAGSQIYFSMAAGAGQKSAAFDGGGWALKKGSSYFSYFPFTPDFYINKSAIPLTYVGQTQKGNANEKRADIGKFGYMVAKGVADDETGSLYFNFERLGDLFRVKIPVTAGTYTSLTVRTDSDLLVQSGTYNAVAMDLAINDPVYGDSLTLDLEDVTFTENGTLVAFIMIAPFDYENRQLTFELRNAEGRTFVSSVRGKNFERGMTYANAPHISVSPAYVAAGNAAGSFTMNISVSKDTYNYTVASDVSWITLGSAPTSGNASVPVTVSTNTSGRRVGHITVSETVNGVLLQNVVTVIQDVNGGDTQGDGGLKLIFEDIEMTEGNTYTFGDDQEEYEW